MIKLFLRITGFMFASYGAYLYVNPQYLIDWIEIGESIPAKVEVRAMYGGLQLGFGLLLLWSAQRSQEQQQMAYAVMIAVFAGLASARGLGMLIDGTDDYNQTAFFYESASFLISVFAYWKLREQISSEAS